VRREPYLAQRALPSEDNLGVEHSARASMLFAVELFMAATQQHNSDISMTTEVFDSACTIESNVMQCVARSMSNYVVCLLRVVV
jgi:hypothetical protein